MMQSLAPILWLDSVSQTHTKIAPSLLLTKSFKKFITVADTYLWIQTKAAISFYKEVRFFDQRLGLRGIRSADLGATKIDQILIYVLSFVPWLISLFVRTPLLNTNFRNVSKRNIKNSHFVLITAESLTWKNLVNAGRESMRVWVQLEKQGYSVQPYSNASITLVDAATGWLPTDTFKKFRELFTVVGPEVCANQFNLQSNEKPVWMLRVGRKEDDQATN